jgi:hypothetical protein
MQSSPSIKPFPLMALALLALLSAMWAGLIRLGWGWSVLQPTLPMSHGPLMISGFLGTVIGIERAVALSVWLESTWLRRLCYAGPLLTGLGTIALVSGLPGPAGSLLMTLGSLGLLFVFGLILRRQAALFTITMAVGALLWFAGNSLWLLGWPIYAIVQWWGGFLMLTIAGERLELNRVLRLSSLAQTLFIAAIGLYLVGLVESFFNFAAGTRLAGIGLVALAGWLLRYDIARYTVKKSGLTRFIAICLLAGYGWLGLGGLLAILFGGVTAGFYYDALHHAVFVGFVISMIFGHAPIIFPAITGRAIPFHPLFYSHLTLLHGSLLLRVVGDLLAWPAARQWGGLLNAAALLLFLLNTALAMMRAK